MTPKLKLQVQTPRETDEQATVVSWGKICRLDGIDMLFSVPNGSCFAPGYNKWALIAKLKAEGLRPGVSDLFLSVARHGFHGLYLELKKKKGGKESEDQITWRIRAQEEGYKVVVCEGAHAAIAEIQAYLEWK
jgi:hypothetical protein